jgi:UDP-2,3-diacylglucosamine pyrophosphatase LpxH
LDYTYEHATIDQLNNAGFRKTDIASVLISEFGYRGEDADIERVRKRVSKYIHRQLGETGPKSPGIPQKPTKQEVTQNLVPEVYNFAWSGAEHIRFAIVSDCHMNSKYTQITHLKEFYDIANSMSIRTFFNVGDIDEGDQMRPGHQFDCYNQGADDHVAEIIRLYPQKAGAKTYFILGNHDASIMKRSGHDIGKDIAAARPDMIYLGFDCAVVNLTPNCTLELRHPWDGTSYAISYKPQKMIDAIPGGEKPNIMAIGHYHKAEYICYRNVHCFQAGTFCAQTPFMRGKGISAMMGGWIVDVTVAKDGSVLSIIPEFIPFYKAIKDDYKNWRPK